MTKKNKIFKSRGVVTPHATPPIYAPGYICENKNKEQRLAYSISEFATKLGVSTGFLRLEAARRKLTLTRLGRRTLVRAEEVERYLKAAESTDAR